MGALTSLHLFGVPARRLPGALVRMGADRAALRATPGLAFWKLLGTGDGRTFDLRDADLRRWGLLGVWRSAADLAAFEHSSPVVSAWRRLADERWRADMIALRARGRWSGRSPLEPTHLPSWGGPVAAITRARLTPRRMRTFWRAVPPVVAALRGAPGLRFSIGIGEAPFGVQGTFSIWDDDAALTGFAYRRRAHREAIRRTATEGWYAEELFARLAVLQTTGTVDGRAVPAMHRPAVGGMGAHA